MPAPPASAARVLKVTHRPPGIEVMRETANSRRGKALQAVLVCLKTGPVFQATQAHDAEEDTPMQQHMRVILVEDEPGDAGLIRHHLKSAGAHHTLAWFTCLAEFARHLDEGSGAADVLLLDLNLPDTRGLETISRCKSLLSDTPIVVLTGHDNLDDSLKALEAGAQDYLIKSRLEADALLRSMRYAIERHQLERHLQASEERMTAAIEGGDLGVWEWDIPRRCLTFSKRLLTKIGHSPDDPECPHCLDDWMARVHPDDLARVRHDQRTHLDAKCLRYQSEYRFQHSDGSWMWWFVSGHVVSWDTAGKPQWMVGIQQDISCRKALEARLHQLAMHDELTGLLNRRSFMNAMQQAFSRVQRHPEVEVGIVMLDIDHFKQVNDTWGHAVGDEVLRGVADSIRHCLRENDVFGRLGGEEFAILLSDTDPAGTETLARRLVEAVAAMHHCHAATPVKVTTSAGLDALKAADSRHDAALARADAALYHAKQGGRNRVSRFGEPGPSADPEGLAL